MSPYSRPKTGLIFSYNKMLGGTVMEFVKANISTGRITGLEKEPYYFEHHCYYAMGIIFEDVSSIWPNNMPVIELGEDMESAKKVQKEIVDNFAAAGIHEGDEVAIFFGNSGSLFAVGKKGADIWIDVKDLRHQKSFKNLNLIIKELSICWDSMKMKTAIP